MTKGEWEAALDKEVAAIESEWLAKDANYTFKHFWTKEMGLIDTLFVDVIKDGKTVKRVKVPTID
jgi:hypothetical protein